MKSFKLGKSYYDIGGHALHDNNKSIKFFLEKEGGINHYKQKRKAYIDYNNSYIPFPFQLHLAYLGKKEREECFKKFMYNYINNKGTKQKNLEEFLKTRFGELIYKYFLKDYNKKLWKTKLNRISTNWKNRILFKNINIFIKGYHLKRNEKNYLTNNFINYPEKGGFQEYIKPFFKKIKDKIKNNILIKKIDINNKIIYTNIGIIFYKNIISTIPINELTKICNLNINYKLFEYLSLQIVAILIKKIKEDKQRIYNHEKKYYFHKCVLNSNSSKTLKEKNEFIFQFESSFKNNKKINSKILMNNCIDFLKEKGFIKNKNDILDIDYKVIKYGYPIQTIKMQKSKNKIIKKINSHNIFTLGRFGNWDYINFDKVILNTIFLFNKKENENINI